MPKTYVIVEQNNCSEHKTRPDGSEYVAIRFVPPSNFAEAVNWPGTKIMSSREPPIRWGCATYEVQKDFSLKLVGDDFDSSDCLTND